MTTAIQSLFQSTTFPTIFMDDQVPAPAENVKRWLSVRDHTFEDGRRYQLLITWSSCTEFPTTYEPLAELGDDGTPTKFLAGMLSPNMTYRIPTTSQELAEFTQTATLLNPETNELYQLPFSAMCVSATLRNMIDDLGGLDGNPIPIGAGIINGPCLHTLRLLQMLQILGNPVCGSDFLKNWSHHEVSDIDSEMRIPQIDAIITSKLNIDETQHSSEIATKIEYPQFKFVSGWADYGELKYYLTATDFLDIQPLSMYISHACASKIANL